MSRREQHPGQGWDPRTILMAVAVGVWFAVNIGAWMAFNLAAMITGETGGSNPVSAAIDILAKDELTWTPLATVIAVVLALFIAAAVFGLWRVFAGRRSRKLSIDRASRSMVSGKQIRGAHKKDAERTAQRLGHGVGKSTGGLLITRMLDSRRTPLFMNDEQTAVMIAGTRSGKTKSLVINAIATAPGCVVTTSSKGDVLDYTLLTRSRMGKVWIFDPQHIHSVNPVRWWWNPLATISTPEDADRLASYFADGCKDPDARADAYFDDESERIFSAYMLAAAVAGGDLGHVSDWLMSPTTQLPVEILHAAGFTQAARRAEQISTLTERQRDGIYGMARRYVGFLGNTQMANCVLPPERTRLGVSAEGKLLREVIDHRHELPELRLTDFVESEDQTLYLLSRAGKHGAVAITSAMAGELFYTGIRRAQRSPGRRLTTPIRAVLDECANTVPLRDLPAWFTDFGSQGIQLLAFFQSRMQGENVWGKAGMRTLYDTANVNIYGGSVKDPDYLRELSDLAGTDFRASTSTSVNRDGQSRTTSYSKEQILDVRQLGAMPVERQLVMFAGNEPVLGEKVFWDQLDCAEEISLSESLASSGELEVYMEKETNNVQ